jgi:hypothetical protein
MIHERLEYDPPVILNLKSDPAKPVTARIAYILGKYVVVELSKANPASKSADNSGSRFAVFSADDVTRIEQMPSLLAGESTTPAISATASPTTKP